MMLIKERARKPVVNAALGKMFDCSRGVGGVDEPCIAILVGEYRLILTRSEISLLFEFKNSGKEPR